MKKTVYFLISLIIALNIYGCASFRKKFTREKEKERPRPVVLIEDYNESVSRNELYEKHFLFWKYWELELIDSLEQDNYKKQTLSVSQTRDNLNSLIGYLIPEKADLIKPYSDSLEKIEAKIKRGFSSSLDRNSLKQEVEKHQRMLEKELMYKKMKDFIK